MVRKGRALLLVLALALLALALRPEAPAGAVGGWMAAAGLTPRFETVDGVRVRYVRAGSGPAVVLLHGFTSSIVTWRDVLPGMARRHDVLALDLPGFGGSDQPPDLSARLYPRLVLALMDRTGIVRASLVGNSMGGAVAIGVAAEAPERVDRLVLIDSAGFNLSPGDRPFMVRLAGSWGGALAERLPIRRALVRAALRQVFFDDAQVTPERVEEYVAPLLRPGTMASVRSLLASQGAEAAAFQRTIAGVRAPTLVLWGRQDAWIPLEHAGRFAAAIPGARTVVLEACGHMPQEERPGETLRLIEAFLAG